MENILIKFETDTAALDEIAAKLTTVKQSLAGLVTGASSSASGTSAAKGTTDNSEKQRLDETRKAVALLIADNQKLMKDYADVSKAFQALQSTIKTSSADSKKSIDALSDAQKKVNDKIGDKAATESFRTQLKKMKSDIIQLELEGQKGSDKYNELIQKAGELSDAMKDTSNAISNSGSDTQAFDSIIAGTELRAGGFSVATGAAGLFNIGTEDVARMQVRLQSAIAITTGLQSVGNAVQKDGALIVGIVKVQTMALDTAKKLENSTTWAGVVAQKALNAVAAANPYVLMAIALATVVGALWAWNAGSDAEADKQKRIAELETLRMEGLERMSQNYKDAGDERERVISNEIELLKAQGAAQDKIAKKESDLIAERLSNATEQAKHYKDEVANLEKNKNQADALTASLEKMKLAKLNLEAGEAKLSFVQKYTVGLIYHFTDNSKELGEKAQAELDILKPKIEVGFKVSDGLKKANQDMEVDTAKRKVDALKNARSEAIAVAEIKLLEARKGSAQELAARIGVIAEQRRADLDNTSLVLGERKLRTAKAEKDMADARRSYAISELNDEKSLIESKISLSEKGSNEEFNNKKDLLKKQLDIELLDINQSIPAKLALIDKYQSDVDQMNKDFNDKKAASELQSEISLIESELSSVKAGSNEEYQLKADLIEKKRALDVKSAESTLTNEKEKVAKVIEINAKAQQDINDLTYESQTASLAKVTAIQELALGEDYKNGLMSKAEYEAKKEKITIDSLQKEIEIRKANGKLTIEQEQQLLDKQIQLKNNAIDAMKGIVSDSIANITSIFSALGEGQVASVTAEQTAFENSYTADVEAAKKNKELKLISQAEYDKKSNALALKQKNAEKSAKKFSILANSAESIGNIIFKALETQAAAILNPFLLPFIPYIWGQIPLVVASAAIQIGNINKYAKGRKGKQTGSGEMAWIGEQGPEIMFIPNTASIIPAHKSRKVADAIGIMKEYNIPAMPYVSNKAMEEAKISNAGINYDLLARKIGEQMKQNLVIPKSIQRPVSINVDQSGTRVTDGDTTTHYRNRKYSGEL